MCLMQTDLPVPDGPRIIEIWLSGMPKLRPFRIVVRPKLFLTSMNSTASVEPWSRLVPECHLYGCSPSRVWSLMLAGIGVRVLVRVLAPGLVA